ncbi:MAG: hypothetical protein LQ338_003465 [Usnochroma carphineum]|nr:MAG: hypothetical protein LQ338_003465 [Usnochroma carphineum]
MSNHPAVADPHPASDQVLSSTLEASAYSFLQPTSALQTAALVLAKRYLDPLALSATRAQAQRLQALRRQRKRRHSEDHGSKRPFCMRQVHLGGFRTQQVWEQARRVLDASIQEVEAHLESLLPSHDGQPAPQQANVHHDGEAQRKRVKFAEDGVDSLDAFHNAVHGRATSEDVSDAADLDGDADEMSADDAGKDMEDETHGSDAEDQDIDMDSEALSDPDEQLRDVFVPDKHGLNDGFFSIDDFNKQSEFLENQDARGDPDNEASDEEEIDWGAEPLPLQEQDDLEAGPAGSDGEEDGPTFGNADLNAADAESNASDDVMPMDSMGASTNTNDIMYANFFAPPPRQATRSTRLRALPKTQPAPSTAPQQEDDIDRTVDAVRRDIFEDDISDEDLDEGVNGDAGDLRSRRSNHEKRQAKLAEEIRRLEAASVAKRDWTLSGEARAADRPMNSLLEEDLDFERAGKPVPVITNEVSEDIEALIKRRIINREFDEVIRRRPGDLVTGASATRRGMIELDDTKPQQSLAEMYETEHLKKIDPTSYVDKRDEKLKKEHAVIESLWADISAKLDSLSNWHYKPKPPQANITVISDVPKISMEDARPSAGEGMGAEESMLAPQEVYRPGEERSREDRQKEVVLKSGVPVAREEMSREEKLRRRRREKERIKKKGGSIVPKEATAGAKKAAEKKGVVGDLKRAGVKVIGKKGELVDIEGEKVKGGKGTTKGGGNFKL